MRWRISCLSALVFAPGVLRAQVESGPKAGDEAPALKVVVTTGDAAGKELDWAAERKDGAMIFVFVQGDQWDRPAARFLRALDQSAAEGDKDAQIAAVWLTDDADRAKEYLPRAQASLNLSRTKFAVYPGDKRGPAAWGINADARVTVVVTRGRTVSASFGYRSLNETDAPAALKKLKPKE